MEKVLEIKLRSLWMGLAGINSRYYLRALDEGLALRLIHSNEEMYIPADKVKEIQSRSEETFKDKYGGGDYYLVYYKWKPTASQAVLF